MDEFKCPRCEDKVVKPGKPCDGCGLSFNQETLEDFRSIDILLKKVFRTSAKKVDFKGMWKNIVKEMDW